MRTAFNKVWDALRIVDDGTGVRSSNIIVFIWPITYIRCLPLHLTFEHIFRACIFIHTASIICELYASLLISFHFFSFPLDMSCALIVFVFLFRWNSKLPQFNAFSNRFDFFCTSDFYSFLISFAWVLRFIFFLRCMRSRSSQVRLDLWEYTHRCELSLISKCDESK